MRPLARAGLLAVVALAALVAVLVPSPSDSPLGRVASIDADGPDPRWDTPVDGTAVRRAADVLPQDARYLVWAQGASPLLQGNLKAATQLLFTPALPVRDPDAAEWVFSYRASPAVPTGLQVAEQFPVGPGIVLLRIAR
jgi:hypothetical protein